MTTPTIQLNLTVTQAIMLANLLAFISQPDRDEPLNDELHVAVAPIIVELDRLVAGAA